ncbi:hypothetical protein ABZP36_023212 [Zizania latifolia]
MASPVNPIGMDSIDLNTQVVEFSHLSSYKDIMQSSGRGGTLKRKSGGDASSKAAMLFCPPRNTGRGGSRSTTATARSAPHTPVVVAAAGGSKSTPQFNAVDGGNSGSAPLANVDDRLEDDDGSFGHDHLVSINHSLFLSCDYCDVHFFIPRTEGQYNVYGKIRMEEAKECLPPENLGQLEQIFDQVAVDGSSSYIPGEDIREGCDERIEVDEFEEFDDSPMSANTQNRTNSTSTSVTRLTKKTKSPMVKIIRGVLESLKYDSVVAQKVLQGELMALSIKKALQMMNFSSSDEEDETISCT